MMRGYTSIRPDLQRIRLIVTGTDMLRQTPEGRTLGLGERRAIAALAVDAVLPQQQSEGQK
jgi:hypothetical protein